MSTLNVVYLALAIAGSFLASGAVVYRAVTRIAAAARTSLTEREVEALNAVVQIKDQLLEAKDQRISQQVAWLAERDARIAEMEVKLAGQASEIAELKEHVSELQQALGAKALAQIRQQMGHQQQAQQP